MECHDRPIINYGELSERFYEKVEDQRIPIDGSIELTARCNLRCVHCYCNLPPNDQEAIEKELATEEIFNILDEIADAGCLALLITGGEPLLRKDFLKIYTYAKKKGFIITLFTNGTLITPEIADYLVKWPPLKIEITLYGATMETHEKVTGIRGSYKNVQRGIDLLMERQLPLGLKTMVMTLNKHEFQQMKEYAQALGVEFRFDPILNPRLDGSKGPCKFRLSPEEVVKLDLGDEKRAKEWSEFYERYSGPCESEYLFICGAGISTFHIDPYGKMSACEMTRFQNYDLRCGSFDEGWHQAIPQYLALKPAGDYPCGTCKLMSTCGQCPGWAWLENGNPEAPVEYLCRIAHLRAKALNWKV